MMHSFLQYVAKDLLAKHPEGLSNIAVVFPNKRASLFLNQALYKEIGQPLWSPAYVTISDLFRQHSDLKVPDQMLLVFKLYNIFCEATGSDEPIDHFYSWGQLLLSDFDDLDKNMADADKLFVNLEAWQEMKDFSFLTKAQKESLEKFFGKVLDETEMQQRFNNLWKSMRDIYHSYRESLQSEGLAYEGMLYRQVAEMTETDFRYDKYIFVGFNLLQKVEQSLFSRLKELGRAEFYWDYDDLYKGNGNEAGKYIGSYLERFPNELSKTRISSSISYEEVYQQMSGKKDIAFISAPTENIQARYVSDWLAKNNRIADGSRTAIVLGDEKLLETVVHCLPDEVENVNITTGFPLSSSPVSAFVELLFNLQLKGKVEGTSKFRLRYVNPVLRHPYAKYYSPDCSSLSEELTRNKRYFPDRKLMTDGRDEALELLFTDIHADGGRLPLLSWVADILKRVGVGARKDKDPLMHESIFRMYTLINRLNDIMTIATPEMEMTATNIDPESGKQIVSLSILQRLLSQVVQSTTIPFHGEPLLGIQIMGVLETRNLDFDHVLLLSCNEGNLPKSVNDASFIPHSLRAGFELTTVENKVAIYAYYFQSLLQRAADVTLTYNCSTEGVNRGEMSRFMLQYLVEKPQQHSISHYTLQSGQSATPIVRKPIEKDERVQQRMEEIEKLSPSAINKYLRCQLQFYYYSVCGLREPNDQGEDEIDNMAFGNIFHKAAQLIYDDLSDNCQRPVTAEDIEALKKAPGRIERYLDQAFKMVFFMVDDPNFTPQYNGLQRLNKKVIKQYIERLLDLDKTIAPFDILALEQDFHDNMTLEVNGENRSFKVGGQIDRLDRIEKNGKEIIRVVDYKTGKPLTSVPADVSEIFLPESVDNKHSDYYLQTFIYAGLVRNSEYAKQTVNPNGLPVVPALLFIRQTATEDYDPTLCFKTGRGEKTVIDDINDVHQEFVERLKLLIGEIFNKDLPFHPTSNVKHCEYCPYKNICGL